MSGAITGISLFSWSAMQIADLSDAIEQSEEKSNIDIHGITLDATFRIKFIGLWSSAALALAASGFGLPIVGDYLANLNATMWCSHIDCELESGSMTNPNGANGETGIALYKATFSPLTAARHDLSPLDRPVQIEGGGIDLTEVRRNDITGKPIINAAGDFYEGLPSFYIPGGEFTMTRNEAANPWNTVCQYSFSQNQDNFFGIAPGNGIMGKITFKKVIEKYAGADVVYYTVSYPIRIRTDANGWNYCPLNYGDRYKPKANAGTQAYVDPSGVHAPVFLASDGTLLNPDGSAAPTAPQIYPATAANGLPGYMNLTQQTWASLGLPNPATL